MAVRELDPDRVVLQLACTNYDSASRLVSAMLGNMVKAVGVENDTLSGPAESALGWDFFPLAISRAFVQRLANMPGNDIWHMKGGNLDEKFATWLNRQLELRTEGVQVRLLSDLKSSRFGLF